MRLEQHDLPRCDKLDGSSLRIVHGNIEAGQFCEANCVTITDGERTVVYVPLRSPSGFAIGERVRMTNPGSWVDGRVGTIEALNVVSSDQIHGHQIKVKGVGITVVPEFQLSPAEEDD